MNNEINYLMEWLGLTYKEAKELYTETLEEELRELEY